MDKKEAIKFIAYLVTSARGCINEPKVYGSFRLVDSASKFYEMMNKQGFIDDDKAAEIITILDDKKYTCMTDENEFIEMLDLVVDKLVDATMNNDDQ